MNDVDIYDTLAPADKAQVDARVFVAECHRRQNPLAAGAQVSLRDSRNKLALLFTLPAGFLGAGDRSLQNQFMREATSIQRFGLLHRTTEEEIDINDLTKALNNLPYLESHLELEDSKSRSH